VKDRPYTVWVNSDCDSGNLGACHAHFRQLSLGTEGIDKEPGLSSYDAANGQTGTSNRDKQTALYGWLS